MARPKGNRRDVPEPPRLTLEAYRRVTDQRPGDGVAAAYAAICAHAEDIRVWEVRHGRRAEPEDGAAGRLAGRIMDERSAE